MSVSPIPPPAAAPPARRPFRLTRFFSLASGLGVMVVTAALFGSYRQLSDRHLVEHESRANAALTQAVANAIWQRYSAFVHQAAGRTPESLRAAPEVARLTAELRAQMAGLAVAKVKIYDLGGLTVYSTDARQIGESKAGNAGFLQARNGQVASALTFRESFDAFEGVLSNRDLIASYIPVRQAPGAVVEGVFEIYSDVTDLLTAQRRAQWQVAGLVLGLLLLLYGFLLLVVRKADGVIARQEAERRAREDQVRHQAYHDALTGLPNRAHFVERLGETLAQAGRHGQVSALMFVDLDRFKAVNDSLGHQAGDELLQVLSDRLRACLRQGEQLFRVGGDEFTLILPQLADPGDAAAVARRLLEVVAQPIVLRGHELTVGATIGTAVFPDDGRTPDQLLKNADAAMYAAKGQGRGRHAYYRAEMNERALERMDLEQALQKGFRAGEFTLYFQPRIDSRSREVVAQEALLRWVHPTRGVLEPPDFLQVLEDCGLMTAVGEWVLRTACLEAVRWSRQGDTARRVAVNVSLMQFHNPGFLAMVQRVLKDTGVPPGQLELELTESMLATHPQRAMDTIRALKALGLRVSIDDFGAGHSALNQLRQCAIDGLKIDRGFTQGVTTDPRSRALAGAIVQLAQALDIAVVAEGVETEAQAAFFEGLRCDEMQGFLFGHPLPAERVGPPQVEPASVC